LILKLKNEIGVKKPVQFGSYNNQSSEKAYIGKVLENSFEIQRAINYRNSFLPQIKGNITTAMNGSNIEIEMRMLPMVKIFMIIWFSFVTFFLIITLLPFLKDNTNAEFGLNTVIPFIMLIFGILLVTFGFKLESKKSIKDLENLMQAKIVQQQTS